MRAFCIRRFGSTEVCHSFYLLYPLLITNSSSHIDAHHKCTILGCKQAELFSAKGQLDRHKRSVHGIGPTNQYYCDQSGCTRGVNGRGFIRRDHLLQHAKSHREEPHTQKRARVFGTQSDMPVTPSKRLFTSLEEDSVHRDGVVCSGSGVGNGTADGSHYLLKSAAQILSNSVVDPLPLVRKRLHPSSPPNFAENVEVGDVSKIQKVEENAILIENRELKAKVAQLEGRVAGLEYALAQLAKK